VQDIGHVMIFVLNKNGQECLALTVKFRVNMDYRAGIKKI